MEKKSSLIKDILEVIIGVAIISFILLKFILIPCQVQGSSMYPVLEDKDRAYSFIITRKNGINRFDICVIQTNLQGKDRLIVKRAIGLPNDTVEYKDNKLYINGTLTDESYLDGGHTEDLKITLGEDEYFCLGDNRDISRDSRYYGPFKGEDILATNIFVLYPFSNFGVKK